MDAIKMITERRSVRKYKNEKVDRELLKEIVDISRWSPSWANTQIVRYNVIDDEAIIKRIADEGVKGFAYNQGTLSNTKGIVVLSYVLGKSGKLYDSDDAEGAKLWEMFDAGIACQTFCLAAHAKGLGTCIFGVIDGAVIKDILSLPEDETVASVITYGYAEGEHPKPTPRKELNDIIRFK